MNVSRHCRSVYVRLWIIILVQIGVRFDFRYELTWAVLQLKDYEPQFAIAYKGLWCEWNLKFLLAFLMQNICTTHHWHQLYTKTIHLHKFEPVSYDGNTIQCFDYCAALPKSFSKSVPWHLSDKIKLQEHLWFTVFSCLNCRGSVLCVAHLPHEVASVLVGGWQFAPSLKSVKSLLLSAKSPGSFSAYFQSAQGPLWIQMTQLILKSERDYLNMSRDFRN